MIDAPGGAAAVPWGLPLPGAAFATLAPGVIFELLLKFYKLF
jgi:hypothetical protein